MSHVLVDPNVFIKGQGEYSYCLVLSPHARRLRLFLASHLDQPRASARKSEHLFLTSEHRALDKPYVAGAGKQVVCWLDALPNVFVALSLT